MRRLEAYKKILPYFLIIIFTILIFGTLYKGEDLVHPISYSGDSIAEYAMAKAMINNGTWMKEELLGNGNFTLYDHNTGNTSTWIVFRILAVFTNNPFLLLNLYYGFTFITAAIAAFWCMKAININIFAAMLLSILYAFTPYHQLRFEHIIWLGCYYVIPLTLMICLYIKGIIKIPKINIYISIVLVGLSNIYYIFFSGIFIGIIILSSFCRKKEFVVKAAKLLSMLLFSAVFNLLPSFIYYFKNGVAQVFSRQPQQAEIYGLKLISLFLPRENHRLESLSLLHNNYMELTGTNYETMTASLGIVGCVGFIGLLILLLCYKKKDDVVDAVVTLNMWSMLIGALGTLGGMIAYAIPMIRCYGRISIYIAFFSLVCLGFFLSRILDLMNNKKRRTIYFVLMGIFCFGILDQTTALDEAEQIADRSDEKERELFLDKIDEQNINRIYQYPAEAYPGGGYEYLKWYISDTHDITWGSGGMVGSQEDAYNTYIEKQKANDFVEELLRKKYEGLMINKQKVIEKYGKENYIAFENSIKSLPIQSFETQQEEIMFISLKDLKINDMAKTLVYPVYSSGVGDEFMDDKNEWLRWMERQAVINIVNDDNQSVMINMNFKIFNSDIMKQQTLDILLNGKNIDKIQFGNDNEERYINVQMELTPGKNKLELKSSANVEKSSVIQKQRLYYIKQDTYERVETDARGANN